jgi:hypothetical protein
MTLKKILLLDSAFEFQVFGLRMLNSKIHAKNPKSKTNKKTKNTPPKSETHLVPNISDKGYSICVTYINKVLVLLLLLE